MRYSTYIYFVVLLTGFLQYHLCMAGNAVTEDSAKIRQIEQELFQFHLNSLDTSLQQLKHPSSKKFYTFHQRFYRYISLQSPEALEHIEQIWDQTIDAIKELPDDAALKEVMLAEVYGKRALWEFIEKDYLTSVWYIRLSKQHIRKQAKLYPQRTEHLRLLGLYNVLFGAIPQKYQWVTHTLGFPGDVNTGLSQLRQAARQHDFLHLESIILHYFATKNLGNQPNQALQDLRKVIDQNPKSIILDYCLISGYLSMKYNDKAYQVLSGREAYFRDSRVQFIPLWDFHYGRAYYYQADYEKAIHCFDRFLHTHQGKIFRTDAMFRMGMSHILSGDYVQGKQHLERLLEQSISDLEEDQYAFYLAKSFVHQAPSVPTQHLFRARNAYDGGYYSKALSILNKLNRSALSIDNLTYMYYLSGRIYHSTGDTDLAKEYYQLCIDQPERHATRWQQAYSCFYMANLAHEQQNQPLAMNYYQKALFYDDYFYQPSLENQCKLAMKRLE